MHGSGRLPVKLDRADMVAATPPGPLWRDTAFLLGIAGVALLVLPALLLADPQDVPLLASVALMPGALALLAPWFWWRRLGRQAAPVPPRGNVHSPRCGLHPSRTPRARAGRHPSSAPRTSAFGS